MKVAELRQKTVGELTALILEHRRGLFNLRMQQGVGHSVKPHVIKESRQEIARIKTIISEMNKAGGSKK
ncbi:MAG: 50S ribosomal protein L29 [Gammaproteobacteria bacterium]|nr:50S ribosomal protein L29 [Gammaproteobacteria bacterium]